MRGVLAAEMPIDFELEALKAQAMAARTYMVRRIVDQDFSECTDSGMLGLLIRLYIRLTSMKDDLKKKWDNSTTGGQYGQN